MKKVCTKCKKEKDISEYYPNSKKRGGYQSWCKECFNGNCKERFERKKAEILSKNKQWYHNLKNNDVRFAEYKKKIKTYALNNKSKHNEANRRYREKNRDKILNHKKQYNDSHFDKRKEYRDSHKSEFNAYIRTRKTYDHGFKVRCNLRKRLGLLIKSGKAHRSGRMNDLIGCNPAFLAEYIESLWQEGMNWDNYGFYGWHVDHIIPCAAFNLTDPEQVKRCFHYSNLQPLWWYENLAKRDKIVA